MIKDTVRYQMDCDVCDEKYEVILEEDVQPPAYCALCGSPMVAEGEDDV